MSPANSKIITVFEYVCHYGPVILLICMMTSETGQKERLYLTSLYDSTQRCCHPFNLKLKQLTFQRTHFPEIFRKSFHHMNKDSIVKQSSTDVVQLFSACVSPISHNALDLIIYIYIYDFPVILSSRSSQ